MADDDLIEKRGPDQRVQGCVAVSGADLKVRHRANHALIGPSGAGKTTVFDRLTKFLEP